MPTRQDAGLRGVRGRNQWPGALSVSRGLDGTLRLGFGPRGLRLVMGGRRPGGRRLSSDRSDPDRDEDEEESNITSTGPLSPGEKFFKVVHKLLIKLI
jgi:hypothetical protein